MEPGSNSDRASKARPKPGPWPPRIEPFVPVNTDFNPRDLKSWAKRTGFNVSGESVVRRDTGASSFAAGDRDLEKGPRPEIESAAADEGFKGRRRAVAAEPKAEVELKDEGSILNGNVNGRNGSVLDLIGDEVLKNKDKGENGGENLDLDLSTEPQTNASGYKLGLAENPGYG